LCCLICVFYVHFHTNLPVLLECNLVVSLYGLCLKSWNDKKNTIFSSTTKNYTNKQNTTRIFISQIIQLKAIMPNHFSTRTLDFLSLKIQRLQRGTTKDLDNKEFIVGGMVYILTYSVVERGFKPRSSQIEDYKIGICSLLSMEE
jgi:hypothetical protein